MRRFITWLRTIRHARAAYAQTHGRVPRLFAPRSFTEKMQWRKLFDRDPLFRVFCDKLATRDLVARAIGAGYLAPLLWTGSAEDIPFGTLVPPYFLKSSHASGQVMNVTSDMAQDHAAITKHTAEWLKICFYEATGEPGYKDVPRSLLAEQALLAADGSPPEERRLFVFGGKVAVINTVFVENGTVRNGAFHTPGWERLDWHFSRFLERDFPRPQRLAEMISVAEQLGKGVDHIRVDIFDCRERIYVGELTPYSWSGMARFTPDAADFALGKYWTVRRPLRRAIATMMLSHR